MSIFAGYSADRCLSAGNRHFLPFESQLFFQRTQRIIKHDAVQSCHKDPGDGIGDEKSEKTAVRGKHCVDPEDPEDTGSEKGDDHGTDSISQCTQSPVEGFHDAQEHIGGKHDFRPLHGPVDDFGIRIENRHDLIAENIKGPSDKSTQNSRTEETPPGTLDDPFVVAGTLVLSDKSHGSVEKRDRTDVKNGLHAGFSGAASHGIGAERVDGRLDDQIGK